MEWIETTGKSVEEAKEAALDELGVDEADAEFQVLAEAQTGLFGRLRSEARVRARVRPTAPRAKEERRDRRDRRRGSDKRAAKDDSGPSAAVSATATAAAAGGAGTDSPRAAASAPAPPARSAAVRPSSSPSPSTSTQKAGSEVEVTLDRQAEMAADFLRDLVKEFGLQADVRTARIDDQTVEVQLQGSDLGILIGPKGATLLAIQNLARTAVYNQTGHTDGHLNVDVGGYRQKRTEALIRFSHQVAERVRETGQRTALEPMAAVDRKIVHDTISEIDGVSTISEGEEPRRRVVVLPG